MGTRSSRCLRLLPVLLLLVLFIGTAGCAESLPEMQLHQVAIISANCHLLISGDTVILVDGGTDTDAFLKPDVMLEYVAATGIDHIDAHFVTHYHNDHAQQLDDFSRDYGTENTVVYGPSAKLPARFLPLPNGRYEQIAAGQELDIGPFHVKCVGPEPSPDITGGLNRDSLDLVITYGRIRMLVTGDYMTDYARLNFPDDIADMDIMVFPHHGLEPFAIGPRSLRLINPDLVLVPGRATGSVTAYFDQNNMAPVVKSPSHGNLVVTSDGVTWELHEGVQPGEFTYPGK